MQIQPNVASTIAREPTLGYHLDASSCVGTTSKATLPKLLTLILKDHALEQTLLSNSTIAPTQSPCFSFT